MSNTINSQPVGLLNSNNKDSAFYIHNRSNFSSAQNSTQSNSAQTYLPVSVDLLQDRFNLLFADRAKDQNNFYKMIGQSFGDSVSNDDTEALRQKIIDGDFSWLPEVEVLSASEFSQAQLFHEGQSSNTGAFLGAFGDDTIFLNESILSNPDLALRLYSEGVGHALDELLNHEDTEGDEGAIFSKILMNGYLGADQKQALRNEVDQGSMGGVNMEFSSYDGGYSNFEYGTYTDAFGSRSSNDYWYSYSTNDVLGSLFGIPMRNVNVYLGTFSSQDPVKNGNDQKALDLGESDDDGFLVHTGGGHGGQGNQDAFLRVETAFGITAISMHELNEGMSREDKFDKVDDFKPLLKQVRNIDTGLANTLNLIDEQNGETGLTMTSYQSSLVGNRFNSKKDLYELDIYKMLDNRYKEIADRLGDAGTKAGQAFNSLVDSISKKVINVSGSTYAIVNAIASSPSLLKMSSEIIQRALNTVEPGSVRHVLGQLTNTVGTYDNALNNQSLSENDAMNYTINELQLTENYRFSVAPNADTNPALSTITTGLPQNVKDFVSLLNEEGNHGTVKLMGISDWNPEFYQVVVDGELDAYRYVDGDKPHFEKISRVVIDLSGEFNDWPPSNVMDWSQPQADREGDRQWVRSAQSNDETRGLAIAQSVTDQLQAKGKDVKLLGISATGGDLFEVLVEGQQHAYKLDGDRFTQVTQRNIYAET